MDYKNTVTVPSSSFAARGKPTALNWHPAYNTHALKPGVKFNLLDGPPYANGNIHIGHALNKIIKDIALRNAAMDGAEIGYTLGWDCHGLPIEWAVERKLAEDGIKKADIGISSFRLQCADFANGWVETQRVQFGKLGIETPSDYLTMRPTTEAAIFHAFSVMAERGMVYRAERPVSWASVEQTALAEAEIEYSDLATPTAWVAYGIHSNRPELEGVSLLIWTTTPWTIPMGVAVSYGTQAYAVYEAKDGQRYIQEDSGDEVQCGDVTLTRVDAVDVDGLTPVHPLTNKPLLLIRDEKVKPGMGTGLVHIAPRHGVDDYYLWVGAHDGDTKSLDLVPDLLDSRGVFVDGRFQGLTVVKNKNWGTANQEVLAALDHEANLLAVETRPIQQGFSWRSGCLLFTHATRQVFIRTKQLSSTAQKALRASTAFIPPAGGNRLLSNLETRPDWLVSRQRVWGTPLAMFEDANGDLLLDETVLRRTHAKLLLGHDWFSDDWSDVFTGTPYNPSDYHQIKEVLDVWFDSGCAGLFSDIENYDLVVEGTDQARGWFQTSSLVNAATGKENPKTIATHGFVKMESGNKFSKSKKNATPIEEIIGEFGPDVIRLWVAQSNFADDIVFGPTVLKNAERVYTSLRNIIRYLDGVSKLPVVDTGVSNQMDVPRPTLDAMLRGSLSAAEAEIASAYKSLNYTKVVQLTMGQINHMSRYFDIMKDSLYCDPMSFKRRAAAIDLAKRCLWFIYRAMNPIIPFTFAELGDVREPVTSPLDDRYRGDNRSIVKVWELVERVNLEMEKVRPDLGGNLNMFVYLDFPKETKNEPVAEVLNELREDLFRVSGLRTVFGDRVTGECVVEVAKAEGVKCERSWKITHEVGEDSEYPDLTPRDALAVREHLSTT